MIGLRSEKGHFICEVEGVGSEIWWQEGEGSCIEWPLVMGFIKFTVRKGDRVPRAFEVEEKL